MAQQTVNPYGSVRGAADAYNSPAGAEAELLLNNRGDLQTSLALPERADLVRLGRSWCAAIPSASAFTYVAALPTTRAELVLYNAEDADGYSYIIDRVWMFNISSMGAAQPLTIVGQLVPSYLIGTVPTDAATILRAGMSGKQGPYSGKALMALANTTMGQIANRWAVLGSTIAAPTTNLGAAIDLRIQGRYIVTPKSGFALAGVAGTAAGTAIIGVEWHEVRLTVGP